jgi:hypothetical protein
MTPAFFLIAIMGCGEGDAPCRQVRLLDAHYQSRAACVAASEDALARNSEAPFPVVVAQCVAPAQAASLRVSPAELRLPEGSPPAAARIASSR